MDLQYKANHVVNMHAIIQALSFHVQSIGKVDLAQFLKTLGFSNGK